MTGGSAIDGPGYFVEPTVLIGAGPDHPLVREEVFGPVIAALPFDDVDDLARQANDSHYGLAAGVWTVKCPRPPARKRIKAGTVHVTLHVLARSCVGGYKQWGWGARWATTGDELRLGGFANFWI